MKVSVAASIVYNGNKVRCFDREGFVVEITANENINEDELDEIAVLCVDILDIARGPYSEQTYIEVMDKKGFCEDLCEDDKNCFTKCIKNLGD